MTRRSARELADKTEQRLGGMYLPEEPVAPPPDTENMANVTETWQLGKCAEFSACHCL